MWERTSRSSAVLGTIALYTLLANAIPQVESEVPEELSFTGDVSPEQLIEAGEELYNGAGGARPATASARALQISSRTREASARSARAAVSASKEKMRGAYPVDGRRSQRLRGRGLPADHARHVANAFRAQIWSLIAYLQSQGEAR